MMHNVTGAVLRSRWYAQPNDVIGGWSVMTCDKPPSAANHLHGEYEAATFMDRATARHVAHLHNGWLDLLDQVTSAREAASSATPSH